MVAHDIEIALVEGPVEDDELESHAWRTDVMSLIVDARHPSRRPNADRRRGAWR
jgi:hypothetical protein